MHTIVPVVVYLFCYILYWLPTASLLTTFFFTQVCLTVKAFCKNSSGICTLSLLIFQTDFCRCVSGWLLAQDICKCDAWFQFVSLLDLYSTGLSNLCTFLLLAKRSYYQRYKRLSSKPFDFSNWLLPVSQAGCWLKTYISARLDSNLLVC